MIFIAAIVLMEGVIMMEDQQICGVCKHFIQHYVYIERAFRKIPAGHCICKRSKRVKAGQKACEQFQHKKNRA